jgi:GTP cyclohydrolase I
VYDLPVITAEARLQIEAAGDEHVSGSSETPMREGAFDLSDEEKMEIIADHFAGIMHALGLDLNDDSLSGTPHRVAKMFVKEVFSGLNPANKPDSKLFENTYRYGEMLVEKNITLKSYCEHHFVPITGVVHVAYISSGKVIGLSKINRLVQYFGRRPQVQERLNMQIGEELKRMLETDDVAVIIDARHMCVSMRGVQDESSSTTTSFYSGKFKTSQAKDEFHRYIGICR